MERSGTGNAFPSEVDEVRTRTAVLLWILLAVALGAGFAHNFAEMWIRWFPAWRHSDWGLYDRIVEGDSYYTHGPLVPVVSLFIAALLLRYTTVPVRPNRVWGAWVIGFGLVVHLTGCLARVNFVSGFALIVVLAGLVLLLWGPVALRRLWFPLAFLAFMVPLPQVTISQLNFRLKMLAADWAVRAANHVGILAERSGNEVFLEGGKALVVGNVCGGLRTLVSVIAFGAIYAYVCRLRGFWRIFLFAMSVPVAVASNSLRIVGLIGAAHVWGVGTATGWFHDVSGMRIFVLAFLLKFGLEKLLLWVRRIAGRPAKVSPLFHGVLRSDEDEGQWSGLFRAAGGRAGRIAGITLVLAAGGAWWLNRPGQSTWSQQTVGSALPKQLSIGGEQWVGYDDPLDPRELIILETTERMTLNRRYVRARPPWVDFTVVFSQDNRKGTHPPEVCLEGGGNDIVHKGDVVVRFGEESATVPCRELIVGSEGSRAYVLYTYKCGDTYTRSFWRQQLVIFLAGLLHRDSSGALIRVSTPIVENTSTARQRAMGFLEVAMGYLDRALR